MKCILDYSYSIFNYMAQFWTKLISDLFIWVSTLKRSLKKVKFKMRHFGRANKHQLMVRRRGCLPDSNDLWKALKAFSSLYLIETLKLVDLKGTSNKSTTPYKSPSFARLLVLRSLSFLLPLPIQNHTRELQSITIKASSQVLACLIKLNCRNTIIFKATVQYGMAVDMIMRKYDAQVVLLYPQTVTYSIRNVRYTTTLVSHITTNVFYWK